MFQPASNVLCGTAWRKSFATLPLGGDLAFDLESLTEISATSSKSAHRRRSLRSTALSRAANCSAWQSRYVSSGDGWPRLVAGTGQRRPPSSRDQQITFRTGSIAMPGHSRWQHRLQRFLGRGEYQLYLARTDDNGSRELGLKDADLLSISKNGELAIRLNTVNLGGYARAGTLARVP